MKIPHISFINNIKKTTRIKQDIPKEPILSKISDFYIKVEKEIDEIQKAKKRRHQYISIPLGPSNLMLEVELKNFVLCLKT